MNSSHEHADPFGLFSMRQVVGGCLDWVQEALKIILADYIIHGNPPLNPKFDINLFEKWDLITLINFFVTNYNEITIHIKMIDSALGRTLLFMIKSHRNYWAHQREFSYRDIHRLCDSIELLLENFDDERLNELREKASFVRKHACLYMAKEITYEKGHTSTSHSQTTQQQSGTQTLHSNSNQGQSNFQSGIQTQNNTSNSNSFGFGNNQSSFGTYQSGYQENQYGQQSSNFVSNFHSNSNQNNSQNNGSWF